MSQGHEDIDTLGKLKESGWESRPVKEEIRSNLVQMIQEGEPLFPGILGYGKSVIPQIQHALLARHDLILLGLRGQAKTRILRMLVRFLDEYMPIVAGSEINDDPYHPISRHARQLVEEEGDDTPIEWVHRSKRYGEKLATPDTTVADLIGDLDPIKAASEKLTLADERVINFGLIPRTNRGIFVINELPDLQPRIQVSLLNIMQERDIQIRGFNVRIPMDIFMAYSANPEDYTNRGNIITPLKDRIDSQILTHYPRDLATGMKITEQEAWMKRNGHASIEVPHIIREIVEQVAVEARDSEYIDQKSGVSTRMTITAVEQLISAAERRCIANGEESTTVRVTDLFHMVPALTGKMELVYEGEQEGAVNVARHIIGKAVKKIFTRRFPDPQRQKKQDEPSAYREVLDWFSEGNTLEIRDDLDESAYRKALDAVPGLKSLAEKHGEAGETGGSADREEESDIETDPENVRYALMDLVLEGLHQHSMLGRDDLDEGRSYTDMLDSMLGSMGDMDDLEDLDDYNS